MQKDLGLVTAYGAALEGGYTGTFAEYKEKMLELLDLNLSTLGAQYDDTEIRNLLASKVDKGSIPDFKSIRVRSKNWIARNSDLSSIVAFRNDNFFGVVDNNGDWSANWNDKYIKYFRKNPSEYFKVNTDYTSVELYDGLLIINLTIQVIKAFEFYPAGGYSPYDYSAAQVVPMYLFERLNNITDRDFYPNICGRGMMRVFRNRLSSYGIMSSSSIINKEYAPIYNIDRYVTLTGCNVPVSELEFSVGESLSFDGIFSSNALYSQDNP